MIIKIFGKKYKWTPTFWQKILFYEFSAVGMVCWVYILASMPV